VPKCSPTLARAPSTSCARTAGEDGEKTNREQLTWMTRVEVDLLRRELEGKLKANKP
jgi:hypothetical protein